MSFDLLVGTYTRGTDSKGIYSYSVTDDCDSFNLVAITEGVDNPSFLVAHPTLDVIYAANEVSDFSAAPSGAVSAFSYRKGFLSFINQQSSSGANPCHLTIDANGRYLVVSNYSGGSLSSLALSDTGAIGSTICTLEHRGSSIDPTRQERAHIHSSTLSPQGRNIFIADLGMDQLVSYPIDHRGELAKQSGHVSQVRSGAADGQYLYATNRGHDSVSVYLLRADGRPEMIQNLPTGGKHPRHFAFTKDQQFLYVANRDTNNVVIFRRDSQTGLLDETGYEFSVPAPVYLLFL